MSRPVGTLAAVLVALLSSSAPAPAQPAGDDQPHPSPTFRAGSTAVVVDAIVRDRKGQPVTDLTLQDFELYEDGVRQQLGALTLVAPDAPWTAEEQRRVWQTGISEDRATAAGPDHTASEGEVVIPGQTVVALVFDRLSPESRVPATQAALSYLQTPERPDDFVGVFELDLSLQTVQTFTNDRRKLRQAIESATERPISRSTLNQMGISVGALPATAGAEFDLIGVSGVIEAEFLELQQLQQGHASIYALRALSSALAALPGRKTIVLFSDGLPLRGDEVRERFDSMIELANRANVSIYPIDTVGLRIHSQDVASGRAISQASVSDLETAIADPGSLAGGGRALSTSEAVLRGGSTTHVFGRLAKETGGFVIENTNDLAGGFRRIDADRRFHYLLTYTPADGDFNGEYRKIEVKVKRRGVNVRARRGYAAVHAPGIIPRLSYEAPALAALAQTPRPNAVAAAVRALHLPQPAAPGRVALAIRVPASAVTLRVDEATATYATDFTVLARITDEKGNVVRKASQPYRLSGPADAVEAARAGEVVFFRSPELPPGTYTVEYAIHDALAERAGAGSLPLVVQEDVPGALQVSDLVLLDRAEQVLESERDESNPLIVGDVLLFPVVSDVLSAGRCVPLAFYVGIRPDRGRPQVTADVSLTRSGQAIAGGPLAVGGPGPDGRIHQMSRITVGDLGPGDYTLAVTVSDGASTQTRSARFLVK